MECTCEPSARATVAPSADDQLYPSVALSDTANALGHAYAAWICWGAASDVPGKESGLEMILAAAALGFAMVALAAVAGVIRFGFFPAAADCNGSLAKLAAFVGFPLVGLALHHQGGHIAVGPVEVLCFTACCAVAGAIARSLPVRAREPAQALLTGVLFVVPAGGFAVTRQDGRAAVGLGLFILGGAVIGPKRHKRLLGVRREDWFHYCIATAAILLATQLVASAKRHV